VKRNLLGLIIVLLLALVMRADGAARFPYEQDELYTVNEATNLFHTNLRPGIQARPAFFLLEHPIVTNLGHRATTLRALPFLFGLLGLVATWALARRVMSEQGALVAVILATLSPWHFLISVFGRYYSLLYLLAALVYWRLPIAYDTNRPRDYLWALLPLLVGAWTHPSFVFPIAGAALMVMAITRDGALRWRWPSRTAWLVLWGPFLLLSAVIWWSIRSLGAPATVGNGGDRGLMATVRLIPAMVDWMTPVVFMAAFIGAIALIRSTVPERKRMGWMTLVGATCMLVALFALSFKTAIYADYGVAALPLVLVSAAAAVEWMAGAVDVVRQHWVRWAVLALIVVGMLPATVSTQIDGSRFDYRPAFARILRDGPADAVFTTPIILQREYAPTLRAYEFPKKRARLDSLLAKEGTVWAVVSVKRYGIVGDDAGTVGTWLRQRCRPVDSYQHPRLDYRVYQVDLWQCHQEP
jgi:hypothetical protein